jgi:hypothetical protein
MTPSVSERAACTVGMIASLLVLWAIVVIPGVPWPGYLTATAVAVLASTTAVLLLGRPARGAVALARAIAGRR